MGCVVISEFPSNVIHPHYVQDQRTDIDEEETDKRKGAVDTTAINHGHYMETLGMTRVP